jgi:transcriptional regulator with XRE-family HTH domain
MDRRIAFGRRLNAIRKNLGYSQERLAELACLHRTYIGGIERGERNISLVNIWRIADALKIDPSALFEAPGELIASEPLRSRSSVPNAKATSKKGGTWTKRRKR